MLRWAHPDGPMLPLHAGLPLRAAVACWSDAPAACWQAEAIRQVGDVYNKGRLTPFVKRLFSALLRWRRK